MAKRKTMSSKRKSAAPQGTNDKTRIAAALQQERATRADVRRQENIANSKGNRRQNRRVMGLGYPVSVPGVEQFTYNALGETDDGREFALINLHPCGEFVVNSCGIPDESQVCSVTPSFRGDSVVSLNANYFVDPPTLPADYRYDIQLVVLPIPEIDYIFRVRVNQLNTGWSRWVVRRTSYFSAAADGTSVGLAESGYSFTRVVGRGITVHFDAPSLADQGRLIAGQIQAPHRQADIVTELVAISGQGGSTDTPVSPIDSASVQRHIVYLPQSETELTVQDVYAAQWEARYGSYIPHRFVQPTQEYTELSSGRISTLRSQYIDNLGETPVTRSVTTTVPKTYLALVDNAELRYSAQTAQQVYMPDTRTWGHDVTVETGQLGRTVYSLTGLAENGSVNDTYGTWGVSDFINQYTSVQFFLGIQNTAQLHVKTRLHLECQAHAQNSPVTPFIHKSPTIDRTAMHIVSYISQNQAHVFFASDNDLSSILKSIGKILPGVLDALSGSGIPLLENVGKIGGNIGRGLKTLVSGF